MVDEADPLVEHQGALVPLAWITAMRKIAQGTSGDSIIMIRGESGTGKDVLARMLHTASGRGPHPFIKVDCAARPSDRLASRLFGYERDSRGGAGRRKLGAVEFAHRGTLFLDDVGALPPPLHPHVLRLLQSRDGGRPAAARAVPLDVRILLATRRPLLHDGQPWESTSVLKILDVHLAPLRARRGQIAPLAEFFLARFNAWYDRNVRLSSGDLRLLTDYFWPGNVRELETEIRRLVLAAEPSAVSHHIRSALDRKTSAMHRQTA